MVSNERERLLASEAKVFKRAIARALDPEVPAEEKEAAFEEALGSLRAALRVESAGTTKLGRAVAVDVVDLIFETGQHMLLAPRESQHAGGVVLFLAGVLLGADSELRELLPRIEKAKPWVEQQKAIADLIAPAVARVLDETRAKRLQVVRVRRESSKGRAPRATSVTQRAGLPGFPSISEELTMAVCAALGMDPKHRKALFDHRRKSEERRVGKAK